MKEEEEVPKTTKKLRLQFYLIKIRKTTTDKSQKAGKYGMHHIIFLFTLI
jgi:hypothetical protein